MRTQMQVNKCEHVQIDKDVVCKDCGYTLVAKSMVFKAGKGFVCAPCNDIRKKRRERAEAKRKAGK